MDKIPFIMRNLKRTFFTLNTLGGKFNMNVKGICLFFHVSLLVMCGCCFGATGRTHEINCHRGNKALTPTDINCWPSDQEVTCTWLLGIQYDDSNAIDTSCNYIRSDESVQMFFQLISWKSNDCETWEPCPNQSNTSCSWFELDMDDYDEFAVMVIANNNKLNICIGYSIEYFELTVGYICPPCENEAAESVGHTDHPYDGYNSERTQAEIAKANLVPTYYPGSTCGNEESVGHIDHSYVGYNSEGTQADIAKANLVPTYYPGQIFTAIALAMAAAGFGYLLIATYHWIRRQWTIQYRAIHRLDNIDLTLKVSERTLYTKLHEIEDSRNIQQDVETWYIDCNSRWHGAHEHIFYYGIFDTIIKRTRELSELKYLKLTDMIIGRNKLSMSITKKDIACLKGLNSDNEFRKIGSMFLAKYAKNVCFDKDDFRIEEGKSRSFASYIVLDMICRMCVMENVDIDEAYPALEESKDELMIICVAKKRNCLSEYRRFSIREISFDGTSTESLEAENAHDKNDKNVQDLIRRYGIEVNETLSHHILGLMEKHSNLEAAKVSFVRSTKTGYDYSEPCIVLYCLGKTLVPYGEDLFPVSLQHPKMNKTFKTDVREGYYVTCHGRSTSRHQELAMGCSIGEKGHLEHATLGPLVECAESGEMGFLTVRHLFQPTTRSDILLQGTEVVQPSDLDVTLPSSSSGDRVCGKVVTSHIGDQLDAVLVQISQDRIPKRGNFIEVDKSDLKFAGFRIDQQPTFDDGDSIDARTLANENRANRRIIKIGMKTGLTKGTLSTTYGAVRERSLTLDYTYNGRRDSRIIHSQLLVDSYFARVFCQQGDSGSAVFLVEDDKNNTLKCIGMLIGMVLKDCACVVTPIQNILPVLQHKCGKKLRLKKFHFEDMQVE